MIVAEKGSILRLLAWQWRHVLIFTLTPIALLLAYKYTALPTLLPSPVKVPTVPVTGIGAAIGFFAGFRANASYQRWWEGRKLWGRMINTSRHFCLQALHLIDDQHRDLQVRLVHRHIAYVHALRTLLRKQDPLADEELLRALPDSASELHGESNLTHALLDRQSREIAALADQGVLHETRFQQFDESIRHLLDIQGGCERIKKTPLPRGVGFILGHTIMLYNFLFSLALLPELGWYTVPLNLIVCLSFALISEIGRVLEDPFNMYWNALPLSAMSRTIEVNLRQRLDEQDIPPLLQPTPQGVLM